MNELDRRISVAPMMDYTDRHCRYFLRLLSPSALLYTEMLTSAALVRGNGARLLTYDQAEHPVALQLGGSDPQELAVAAKMGEQVGYDEVNLNCGCPSDRVQSGRFGACLMGEPDLVSEAVSAMRAVVDIPVTVKCRIGIEPMPRAAAEEFEFLREFIAKVAAAGCDVFVIHARKAILKGLNPKQNREIPPLKYDVVSALRAEFPQLTFVLNGGVKTVEEVQSHLQTFDGVMIGREAYHNPWWLASWDSAFFGAAESGHAPTREAVETQMCDYMVREAAEHGTPKSAIARHMLGLRNGLPGARRWRQVWSDHRLRDMPPHAVMALAHEMPASQPHEPADATATADA